MGGDFIAAPTSKATTVQKICGYGKGRRLFDVKNLGGRRIRLFIRATAS
jgi:hypothetical protein